MTMELTEITFDDFVKNNKNVLIDCWAPWCGPCRRMGPVIEELSKELEGKVGVAKINTDEAPGISARFGISAIPTLLLFKDGVLLESLVGLRPKQDILAFMTAKGMLAKASVPASEEGYSASTVTDADFERFIKSKRYALIDCWAPWCGPCRRMGPIIEGLAKISKDEIAVGKLNVDENHATSLKYNIQSIPTILIYKDGRQVDVIVGLDPSLTPEKLKEHVLGL